MRSRFAMVPLVLRLACLVSFISACGREGSRDSSAAVEDPQVQHDLAQIQQRDTLVAIMEYNSTSYFLYRGEPLGYEYELLQKFAADQEVALKVVLAPTPDEALNMLNRGQGDVVAARLFPTEKWQGRVAYTAPLHRADMVLVQRGAPAEAEGTTRAVQRVMPDTVVLPVRVVNQPAQLAGKDVHVREQTVASERLMELSDSLTGDIQVVEVDPQISNELLIRRVAQGQVDYTLASEDVAKLTEAYYTNVTIRPVIGPPAQLVWAVRSNSPALLQALNGWIVPEKSGNTFTQLYRKYFEDRRGYRERVESRYLTSETGQLSDYDDVMKRHAAELGWDWRLLASQAYQESRFDPRARSWAGAQGLLQLMPKTARSFGVSDPWDPEQNVAGAVRFLRDLERIWTPRIPDPAERLKFILAAYNTGTGHVEDAQRLAEKNGGNPAVWKDVSFWLLQKSKRQVYTDPVVKYGFSRGLEPVTYVDRVLDRFEHYKQFVRT
ncbi:transglycosylase SLT domain-containing protein [soil metagenome]